MIKQVKPRTIGLLVHYYVQLAESDVLEQLDSNDLNSVKFLYPSGSAVPSSCEKNIRKKFRNIQGVLNAYGLTETGLVSAGYANANLGMIFPQYTIKIVDLATGISINKLTIKIFHIFSTFFIQR